MNPDEIISERLSALEGLPPGFALLGPQASRVRDLAGYARPRARLTWLQIAGTDGGVEALDQLCAEVADDICGRLDSLAHSLGVST